MSGTAIAVIKERSRVVLKKRMLFGAFILLVGLAIGVSPILSKPASAQTNTNHVLAQKHKIRENIRYKQRWHRNTRYKGQNYKNLGHYVVPVSTKPNPISSVPSTADRVPLGNRPTEKAVATPTLEVTNNPAGSTEIQRIVDAINKERQSNGLGVVTINQTLNKAASVKAQDMQSNNYFAHVNPDGKSDFDFLKDVGYRYQAAGSNLAKGNFGSPEGVVSAWMNSPGHRANILADYGQEVGIGVAGDYFVMFITKPL